MMTTIYKLMEKMLATRMAPILVEVVSPHPYGFIKGRSIYDKILAVMVGMEYAQLKKKECVCLHLDLDKA